MGTMAALAAAAAEGVVVVVVTNVLEEKVVYEPDVLDVTATPDAGAVDPAGAGAATGIVAGVATGPGAGMLFMMFVNIATWFGTTIMICNNRKIAAVAR